ncbi:Subtilisin-like serine protease [Ignavibacterium album JCM 16511]|uniref:Subtilisin-like serine protease n=1 Tax=Ignavibacterium album (strain DSM 19864 / JCM 16511 / NBRC 101810 / Mat9-16) TaxID=945713 RepID=I0AM65_IGNAJ|nr:S8 family peptidase [Ignavibacterium album]AFH50072.1 Subtilisin-like serine protease [Ignavibacterium album JCM 16511]
MSKHIIFLLVIFSSISFSQQKYFIYFKDKGSNKNILLSKSSNEYQIALNSLTEKAIERRKKNLGDEIIRYEDLPIRNDYINELKNIGVQIIHKLNWFNCVSAFIPEDKINIVRSLPFVEEVKTVRKIYYKKDFARETILKNNNLNLFSIDYGASFTQLNLSDIPFVHSKGIDGRNVLVGLLDSGFDWKRHTSLSTRNVIAEYDFVFDDSVTANQSQDVPGQDFHGTLVFSIIGGYRNSVLIGSAFNSSFLLAKTEYIATETHTEEDNYAAALIWMENLGVDITSSSLGYSEFDTGEDSYTYEDMNGKTTIVSKAIDLAFERGVVTFTSAGNEGNTKWKYITAPADAFNVIAVGSVDSQNRLASFSSVGPTYDGRIKPEIVAMGVSVYGALAGTTDEYRFANGTSTSSPIAAGVAALLLSKFPHLTNSQVRSIILESSSNSQSPNNQIGYGLISAKSALEFPNIRQVNGSYLLNKIFFDDSKNPNSIRLHISEDGASFTSYNFNTFKDDTYEFVLPSFSNGKKLEFFFTYQDSSGNLYRVPSDKNFKMNYGSLIISLNLSASFNNLDYTVSDIYPNPFLPLKNKFVKINYRSPGNELFKLSIIDAAGRSVKEISQISNSGENIVEWDGTNDDKILCSSGVYYFLITLNGKQFGKKLVLLK